MADPASMVERVMQPGYAPAGSLFPETPLENIGFADSDLAAEEEFRA
jgi:hypothetical protein